jgi:HEAT repeat protein
MPAVRMLDALLLSLATMIVAVVLGSLAVRFWREGVERRKERLRERWEPVFHGRIAGDEEALPRLGKSERLMFLGLWAHQLGYVRDEAARAVVEVGRDVGIAAFVLRLLHSPYDWKRVVAMQAAGLLRLDEARETLISKLAPSRPRSSMAAVSALLLIDLQRGLQGLEQLLRYPRWPLVAMLSIVRSAGPQAIGTLSAMTLSALPGRAKEIAQLIELTGDASALPALRERLQFSRDDEEIASIIRAIGRLGGAEDHPTILALTAHSSWIVRMQSACALGLLGGTEDHGRLLMLLRDPVWWVRYRAAQALLILLGASWLRKAQSQEGDPYAREMLARVLAEHS